MLRRCRLYHTRQKIDRIGGQSTARAVSIRTSLIFTSWRKGERHAQAICLCDFPGETKVTQKKEKPRRSGALSRSTWRREPESNRPKRLCRPLHNRFAIAPKADCPDAVRQATDFLFEDHQSIK